MISLDKQVIETTFPVVCSAEVAVEGVALGTSLGESWCGDEKGKGHGEREVQVAGPRVIFCIK